MTTTQHSTRHTCLHANQMHSPRSNITLHSANHTASRCGGCTQITLETLHQSKSANLCCNQESGSRRSHRTCHGRMERANGNGARWPEMLGQSLRLRNCQFPFVGIT
eukprot:5774499-Pleurochrysis_carterae.AAC.1